MGIEFRERPMSKAGGGMDPIRIHHNADENHLTITVHPKVVSMAKQTILAIAALAVFAAAPMTFLVAGVAGIALREQLLPVNDAIADFWNDLELPGKGLSVGAAYIAKLLMPGLTALCVGQHVGSAFGHWLAPRPVHSEIHV